jgi:hypothetical protein
MNWYQNHRMEWISETLRVFGYINREHLMEKFGLSKPQASIDLNTFLRVFPGKMHYDLKQKKYVADETKN